MLESTIIQLNIKILDAIFRIHRQERLFWRLVTAFKYHFKLLNSIILLLRCFGDCDERSEIACHDGILWPMILIVNGRNDENIKEPVKGLQVEKIFNPFICCLKIYNYVLVYNL